MRQSEFMAESFRSPADANARLQEGRSLLEALSSG
jgi:hypothetical protein